MNEVKLKSSCDGSTVSAISSAQSTEKENKHFQEIMAFCPSNMLVFENLRDEISNQNIMPFAGAGVSAFAYCTWRDILIELSNSLNSIKKSISLQQIENSNFLDAAQTICNGLGKATFFTTLRRFYSENKIDDNKLKENAAYYIPQICNGNCITTNYDRVLEHSFTLNSMVYDSAGINDTFKLATYFRSQNKKGLIFKIHGDILSNSDNILLTRDSYERYYAKGGELRNQLEKWLAGKIFLFIGTSLFNDEPIQVLTDIVEEGMVNYAIYPCSYNTINCLQDQFDDLGILPIFYDEKDHSSLTVLLKKLLT